jgi:multiple sugar transport system permease protein
MGNLGRREKRLLLSPTVILLLLFTLFPFVFTLALVFGHVSFTGGKMAIQFAGISNWVRLFHDQRFWNAVLVTVKIVFIAVFMEYCIGLILALLLYKRPFGCGFFRVLYIIPMLLTPIAVGYTWRMILDVARGPIAGILQRIGLQPIGWLVDPKIALYSIIITDIWQWTPFMFLLLYAGLEAIPKDYLEAADVDGATAWRKFLYVIMPLLAPPSIAALLLRSVECFKIVDVIYIMTGGGPGQATESLTLFGYNFGFRAFDLAYGATIAFSLFFMVLIAAMFFTMLTRSLRAIRLE